MKHLLATGGTVLTKGNYKYHIYTSTGNGTFNVSSLGTDKMIDILVALVVVVELTHMVSVVVVVLSLLKDIHYQLQERII